MSYVNVSKLNNPDLPVSNQITVLDAIPTKSQFNEILITSALMSIIFSVMIFGAVRFFKSRLFKRIKIISRFYFKRFIAIVQRKPSPEIDIETHDALINLNEQAMWDTALEGLKPLMIALIKKEMIARDNKNEDRMRSVEETQQHHTRIINTMSNNLDQNSKEIRSVNRDAEDNLTDLKRDMEDRCDKIENAIQHLQIEMGDILTKIDKLYDITSSHEQKIAENTVHTTGAYIHSRENSKQLNEYMSSIEKLTKQASHETQSCVWSLDHIKSELWNLTRKFENTFGTPSLDKDGDEIAMRCDAKDFNFGKIDDSEVFATLGKFSKGESVNQKPDEGVNNDSELNIKVEDDDDTSQNVNGCADNTAAALDVGGDGPEIEKMVNEKDENIMYLYDDESNDDDYEAE